MIASLSCLFPEPVILSLCGRTFVVEQLRIKDIAKIQNFLERLVPHPFVGKEDLFTKEGREVEVLRLRREDYQYPVVFGSEQAETILNTVGGRAFLLLVTLGKHDLGISEEECIEIARSISVKEWLEFICCIYHITPRDRFFNLLNPSKQVVKEGIQAPQDLWGEKVDELARAYGVAHQKIGEMTISQFRLARNNGKVTRPSMPKENLTHEEIVERVNRERALLGLD
jgi:hypothetical protein